MPVQAGLRGQEPPDELMSGWDAEAIPQSQEKSYHSQEGRTVPPLPGRPLGIPARLLALAEISVS